MKNFFQLFGCGYNTRAVLIRVRKLIQPVWQNKGNIHKQLSLYNRYQTRYFCFLCVCVEIVVLHMRCVKLFYYLSFCQNSDIQSTLLAEININSNLYSERTIRDRGSSKHIKYLAKYVLHNFVFKNCLFNCLLIVQNVYLYVLKVSACTFIFFKNLANPTYSSN